MINKTITGINNMSKLRLKTQEFSFIFLVYGWKKWCTYKNPVVY